MGDFLAPIGKWFHQRWTNASRKAIGQYYENVTRSSLSKDLIDVLESLVGNHEHVKDIFKKGAVLDQDGVYWDEDSFKKWVTANQPLPVISDFTPTLWRVFVYFARFPFAELVFKEEFQHQRIDESGFNQAYNLLALRGVERLGSTKDGWSLRGSTDNWLLKSPHLMSLMFDGLKSSSLGVDDEFQGLINTNFTDRAEEQLMSAMVLTQPEPYPDGSSFYELEIGDVAKRLLRDNVAPNYEKTASSAVSKNDLENSLQPLLLLRIENTSWNPALIEQKTIQKSEDIEKLAFASDEEQMLLSRRLANALTEQVFGNVDSVTWQSFEAALKEHPNITIRFYELWKTIFFAQVHPSNSSSQNLGSRLSNSVAQFLSLLGPVEFERSPPTGPRDIEDQRQLQLDLQNATLVAEFVSTPVLEESGLVERLANEKWFHILILSTEEEHEIALFTSPRKGVIWNKDAAPVWSTYAWRYGFVQLLPHILTSRTRGLSASSQDGAIKFSPHSNSDPSCESNSVIVDLHNGTVIVEWTDSPLQRLKLKSLKCYQLPRTATIFTTGRS